MDFYTIGVFIAAYLIGSIPSGLVISKLAGHGDIRNIGSGNIGATNVLRTGNKALALITLLFDGSKGAIAIGLAYALGLKGLFILVGLFAILGHIFPIWLKFKGGKGVATTLGVLLAAVPYAGLAACATWLAVAFIFKISSLAALIAIGIAPAITFILYGSTPAIVAFLIAILVWWRHKDNIRRLLKGEEPKINFTKKEKQ